MKRFFVLLLIPIISLSSCALFEQIGTMKLKKVPYTKLKGWESGAQSRALESFISGCDKMATLPAAHRLGGLAGSVQDWVDVCEKASRARKLYDSYDSDERRNVLARRFFERHFVPYRVTNGGLKDGLFTGYYAVELKGNKEKRGRFIHPVYKKPFDLDENKPYHSRTRINAGSLKNKGLELAYVEDPVQLFFLHIQGSGVITLPDGDTMRIGYAGKNNLPYTPIGQYLVDNGELDADDVSAKSIKDWLYANPEKAQHVMEANASYIFFREMEGNAPIGTLGAELTPLASLAVDKEFIPLAAPVWLETRIPDRHIEEGRQFHNLLIAQDTGSAIKGIIRGDIYFGTGEEAEFLAGYMKNKGEYFILLPDTLANLDIMLKE